MRRTWKVWLKGLAAAFISGGANSLSTGLAAQAIAPDTFNMGAGLMMTIQLAAVSAAMAAVIGAAMYLAKSPVPEDEPSPPPALPPASAVVLLLAMVPSIAEATDARIVLECSRTTTIAVGSKVESTCLTGDESVWMDLVVGAQLVALQITGKRKIVELGAAPSLGLIFAWRPSWWTATKVLLGGEALVSATVLALDRALSHVEIWTVAGLNLLGYLSIGIGGRYGLATSDESSDFADLVLTSGLRVPI